MKKTLVLGLTLAAAFAFSQPVLADTLAKIKSSGVVTMGVRESSGGLSFVLADGKFAGFHVELCERVLSDVRKHLPDVPEGGRILIVGAGKAAAAKGE